VRGRAVPVSGGAPTIRNVARPVKLPRRCGSLQAQPRAREVAAYPLPPIDAFSEDNVWAVWFRPVQGPVVGWWFAGSKPVTRRWVEELAASLRAFGRGMRPGIPAEAVITYEVILGDKLCHEI